MKFDAEKALRQSYIDPNAAVDVWYSPQDRTKQSATFGKWRVSECGDMTYNKGQYAIYDYQLNNTDWIVHMFTKNWIDFNEFIPAYFQALKNAGIQKTEILIHY